MEEQRQRSGLFGCLKQVLKAQGIRYKDLAVLMNSSEATIKRLFAEQDCKLSRLMEICDAIGVTFSELVELASKQTCEPSQLSLQTEKTLAQHSGLLAFFMLLNSEFDVETIIRHNQLSQQDAYRYLRELEKLDLIRIRPDDTFYFLVKRPIRWRLGGPLHSTLVKVNLGFLQESINNHNKHDSHFYSSSRLLSPGSIRKLNQEMEDLYLGFQKQATLDQMFYPPAELKPYKMIAATAPFNLEKYFTVPSFKK